MQVATSVLDVWQWLSSEAMQKSRAQDKSPSAGNGDQLPKGLQVLWAQETL